MNHFEKESLGLFPTPMYRLPNMSRELGTNVWIKRDDLCGVALGGNKVRKLEYLLRDAKNKGYDLVMTTGQAQSNHAMLTAACALRLGLDCVLVLKKRGVTARKGNQILNHPMGQLLVKGQPEFQLPADAHPRPCHRLCGGSRAVPPAGDEPLGPVLGPGGAGAARLPGEPAMAQGAWTGTDRKTVKEAAAQAAAFLYTPSISSSGPDSSLSKWWASVSLSRLPW